MRKLPALVTARIEDAREAIFRARSIVAVSAAAATSTTPAEAHATETALRYVVDVLGEVAESLDSVALLTE